MQKIFAFALSLLLLVPAWAEDFNLGHDRHRFKHGEAFPTEKPDGGRFAGPHEGTSRSEVALPLPREEEMFTFVLFGDRTSGRDERVDVLADAVHDVNLLEPDFVINIGDMVQGYNATEPWLRQMREYKAIMAELKCPWFPAAGNHDVYGDGGKFQNEGNFETHFGPLWYAFRHKNRWFFVLYTDEGDRETGAKAFYDPKLQSMSEEQFRWLSETLKKTKDADQVFVVQHQPRWRGGSNYGDTWDKVHEILVRAGNVRAVFAGHTHNMRYEEIDGIEYFTLSTTGGRFNENGVPRIGFQDNFWQVTVRKDRIGVAAIPVASVFDPREVTPETLDKLNRLNAVRWTCSPFVTVAPDGSVDAETGLTVINTTERPLDAEARLDSRDSRWRLSEYSQKVRVEPGERHTFRFRLQRPEGAFDEWFRDPFVRLNLTAHTRGMAVPLPEKTATVPLEMTDALTGYQKKQAGRAILRLNHPEDRVRAPSSSPLQGLKALTLEARFRAEKLEGRAALVSKGNNSELALQLEGDRPRFRIPLQRSAVNLDAPQDLRIKRSRWYHLAAVFDGREIRLYLDGKTIARRDFTGPLPNNTAPLFLGAAVDRDNVVLNGFVGSLDSVRLSSTARYTEDFEPPRDFSPDTETLILLDMGQSIGKRIALPGKERTCAILDGDARIVWETGVARPRPTAQK